MSPTLPASRLATSLLAVCAMISYEKYIRKRKSVFNPHVG